MQPPLPPGNRLLLVSALLIFFALAVDTAAAEAPTVDESVHVTRGYALWQAGDLRLQTKPPLSHWLIGSLLFLEPDLPEITRMANWETANRTLLSNELIWQNGLNIGQLFLLARLPIIFLGLFLGSMMFRWAGEFLSRDSQPAMLVLFALSPNLLASATLATTDFTATVTFVASIYALWRFWQRPSRVRWLIAAICLGLALASKVSSLLLLPVTLLLCYSEWRRGQKWWRPGVVWLSLLPMTYLMLWVLYHFEVGAVAKIPVPIPASTYVSNIVEVKGYIEESRQSFLFGEISDDGWYVYFIVAFLIKTPIPTLLLFAVSSITVFRGRLRRQASYLLFPASALFLAASYSRLNIGYRHILPLLPCVILLATGIAPDWLKRRGGRQLSFLILLWYAASALRQHPHYLAYFNEFVGGSSQGYHYLGDSNLDWGQDLKLLADYVQRVGDQPIYYSYFGASDPAYYGLPPALLFNEEGEPLDFAPANPLPGLYALSVNHVQGMVLLRPDTFDWFRHQEPIDQIGYSILIYKVPSLETGNWVAHCLDPTPALDDQGYVARLLNQEDLRHVYFDCRSSWVIPNQGQPGWYILPQHEKWPVGQPFEDHFARVYSETSNPKGPPYDVFRWDGRSQMERWLLTVNKRAMLPAGNLIELPLLFGDTVQLVGHHVEGSTWLTLWRVQEATDIPLSVAAHLYTDDPEPTIADGLGYTSVQWSPGDLFVQQYPIDQVSRVMFLETGIYNFYTGDHLRVKVDGQTSSFIRISPRH